MASRIGEGPVFCSPSRRRVKARQGHRKTLKRVQDGGISDVKRYSEVVQ